jgi:hypothetical protein
MVLATFMVTSTNDAGPGSLRQAILDANDHLGFDQVTFNISGGAYHTIAPTSRLPIITTPMRIDGTTQTGFDGEPVIELTGMNSGAANGLTISAGDTVIKGLVINRFALAGIRVFQSGKNEVSGNYIGTDVTGNMPLGNKIGIHIEASSTENLIGGTSSGARNVISGNVTKDYFYLPVKTGCKEIESARTPPVRPRYQTNPASI